MTSYLKCSIYNIYDKSYSVLVTMEIENYVLSVVYKIFIYLCIFHEIKVKKKIKKEFQVTVYLIIFK